MDDKLEKDEILDMIPLDTSTQQIADEIIKETDTKKLKDLTYLFNLNLTKKNVLRVLKLNTLLDKVSDQMLERFEKKPGEFSNSDLINYLQVTQNAIDRANKSINLIDENPAITLNQVNINVTDNLSRESRTKIADAVKAILQKSEQLGILNETDKENNVILLNEEEDK